jgi:peroxiredoxin Q/BCP
MFGLLPGRVTYVTDKNGVVQMIFDSMLATKHIPKRWKLLKISVIYSKNLLEVILMDFFLVIY